MFGWIEADSFSRDPLGFLFNQLGHMALGFGLVYAVILFAAFQVGEIPQKEVCAILAIACYAILIELPQGWRKGDTIQDIAFVSYGAISTVIAFTAIPPWGAARVVFSPVDAVGMILLAVAHLILGVLWRYYDGKMAEKA